VTKASLRTLLPMLVSYMGSGGSMLVSAAAQLVTFAILARMMGTTQFATYVTISAFTNVGLQICGLGSQESMVRRVAREPGFYPVMLGHSLLLSGGTGLVLVLAGLFGIPLLLNLSPAEAPSFSALALLLVTNIVLVKIMGMATAAYIAHSRFAQANSVDVAFAVVRAVGAALACLVFGVHTVEQWAAWLFWSHLVLALPLLWLMLRMGSPVWRIVREEIPIGALFSTQFISKAVRANTDLLVLSMIATPEIVGSYGVARRMLDSSYMAVEALNRLIYPGSARLLVHGFHAARSRVMKVLLANLGIGIFAAVAVFAFSPLMPMLFGHDYVSMVGFTQALCWVVIPLAATATALEAFGAGGKQGVRAIIFNVANVSSAGLVALFTLAAGVAGAFGSYYVVETATAIVSWIVLLRFMEADRLRYGDASLPAAT